MTSIYPISTGFCADVTSVSSEMQSPDRFAQRIRVRTAQQYFPADGRQNPVDGIPENGLQALDRAALCADARRKN